MNAPPFPIGVQGVLSIKEQDIETGGFQAVPYLFPHFEEWVKTQLENRDLTCPDITRVSREKVDMSPVALLILNSLLAHGVRPDHSENRVRMAQYIFMYPANHQDEAERLARVHLWNDVEPPARPNFPGDPRDWEKRSHGKAYLNHLGRKRLGLELC